MAALQQGALNHPRRLNDVLRPCEFRRDIVGDRSQPDHLYLQSAAGGLHRFQLFSASAALLRSRRISPGEASDFIESGSGAGEFFISCFWLRPAADICADRCSRLAWS